MVSSLRRLLLTVAVFLPAAGALAAFLIAAAPLAAEDGLLDETFSGDGLLLYGWSGGTQPAHAQAVGAFPDGSLLVAGTVELVSGDLDLGFVKLLEDGTIDTGWGIDGRRAVAIDAEPGGDDSVASLAILPNGSAIAAGFATDHFPDEEFATYRPALVRLDAEGDLEPAFGDGGVAVVDLPWPTGDFWFYDPVFQPDGRAIYVGYCYDCPLEGDGRSTLLLRVGTDGEPDPVFSSDGWIREATGTIGEIFPFAVALDGAGRIVILGERSPDLALLRLTSTGAIDSTFGGGDGFVTFPRPVGLGNPIAFSVDGSSGAAYLSFRSATGPNMGFGAVLRLAANGTPDATFGGDGVAELAYQEGVQMESLVVQSDGKILLGGFRYDQGTLDREWLLYRLTPAGAPDPSFAGNGRRLVSFGQPAGLNEGVHAMTLSGGRLVAVGSIRVGSTDQFGIARITSDLIFRDGFERASTGGWGGS